MLDLDALLRRARLRQARARRGPAPSSATTVTATNTARQPNGTISALPVSGARIGDTLNTSMTSDISRVASTPVCRSRMMARGMTITEAAPMPCTKRKNDQPLDRSAPAAQPIEPSANTHQAEIERRLAPDHVGHRAIDDLADAERDEERHQRHLRRRRRGVQVGRDGRQRRQVHVDRERPDRRQQAEHDRVARIVREHRAFRKMGGLAKRNPPPCWGFAGRAFGQPAFRRQATVASRSASLPKLSAMPNSIRMFNTPSRAACDS